MRPAALVKVLVISGVGLIGGSIGLGARQRFLAERVIGLDPDPNALDAALGMGVIDEAKLSPGPWLAEAELVVLASPARTLVENARALEPHLSTHAVVTDVGGVKQEVVKALKHLRFVGGHPMAGSEKIGVVHADASLLENAVWVLTPTPETDAGALETTRRFVEHLGAHPLEIDPARHDRLVAAVSHTPYLAALALMHLVANSEDRDKLMLLAAGGFRDLTRVASGSPRMSRDMVVGNKVAVREALQGLRLELERLEALLDDPEGLLAEAETAKRHRDSIPIVRRSLIPARFEVVIAVPDRPGELARITKALGDAEVNIKDIEVLSIREAGGAIRLVFESDEQLQTAIRALTAAGYEARRRG
jgi:prephenate dehydrogenase